MKLKDRVAIVTGAGSGLGAADALGLAREGANVVVNDVIIERADEVAQQVKSLGRQAIAIKADVSQSAEVNQMVEAALAKFGRIDILVNNAGGSATALGKQTPFAESSEEVWDWVIGSNLKGVLNCCRAVIGHMMHNRSGKIINIASTSGVKGSPVGSADYSAAKGGIIAFTKSLAKEVGPYGINVNCVSPGPIETPLLLKAPVERQEQFRKSTLLGRLGKPEEVASVVVFLATDDASFVTGQNWVVCGGYSLL